MQKTRRYLLALGVSSQLWIACNKVPEGEVSPEQPLTIPVLSGYVQKGPFVVGTEITVSELDKDLSQTGKSFHATIKDDQGAFNLSNLKLKSNHVELRANGYYFNEVTGKLSSAPLALSALADVAASASVNVNMLTHLEKSRVEYLMSKSRKSLGEAKKQAQTEILAIFNVAKADIPTSEHLNIAQPGEDHAILLAISAILQGTRTESELSELLSKIRLDLREDGKLDTPTLQTALINEATLLDRDAVRANVIKRYADLGLTVSVGDFEKYVLNFVTKSPYTFTKNVHYPATGQYGVNLLAAVNNRVLIARAANHHWWNHPTFTQSFSLAALAPSGVGVRVKIIPVTKTNVSTYYNVATPNGWRVINNGQELEITEADKLTEAEFRVNTYRNDSLVVRFEVYENNAALPAAVRDLVFAGDPAASLDDKIEYPGMPIQYGNLLDLYHAQYTPPNQVSAGTTQYLLALIPPGKTLKVRITSTALPDSVSRFALGFIFPPHDNTWRSTRYSYDGRTEVHEIEATRSGIMAGCSITPLPGQSSKSATIEVFENGATLPTRVSQVSGWR